MTPLEEQLEKLALRWETDAELSESVGNDEDVAPWQRDFELGIAHAYQKAAGQLRALLPLEVTDESPLRVTVDTADLIELLYGATTDNLLIGTGYQLAVNDALAALTQKGEGNDGLYADQNCCVHCGWITCARLEDCLATEGDNES